MFIRALVLSMVLGGGLSIHAAPSRPPNASASWILAYEILGIPLGMMAGALAGTATGYAIGSVIPPSHHTHRSGMVESDSSAMEPIDDCCLIQMSNAEVGAILGLIMGFSLGGFMGQATGIYLGAKHQGAKVGYGSTLLATAASDALGMATAAMLMIPSEIYREQAWMPVVAVLSGLTVALAVPVLWVGHHNRSMKPVVTLPRGAHGLSQAQWGLQAELLHF